MKKLLMTIGFAIIATACSGSTAQSDNVNQQANTNSASQGNDSTLTVSSHSRNPSANSSDPDQSADSNPNSGAKSKWTQSGDPIDTGAFDLKIAAAEKDLKARPDDAAAKKTLAEAFLERAKALTDARQYASALGDYRRVLKHDPANGEAKEWIGQIIGIYDSLNKRSPPEGEEPPPLEFKKGA